MGYGLDVGEGVLYISQAYMLDQKISFLCHILMTLVNAVYPLP